MTTTRRNSRQRTLVYQAVKDSHSHPNAEEVYLLVRRQLPDISLGTVYRNLNLLVEMGLLHRIYTGMGADRCRGNSAPTSDLLLLWGSV